MARIVVVLNYAAGNRHGGADHLQDPVHVRVGAPAVQPAPAVRRVERHDALGHQQLVLYSK